MIIAADDNTSFIVIVVELLILQLQYVWIDFIRRRILTQAEKLNYGSGVKVQMKHDRKPNGRVVSSRGGYEC